jgi:ABC-2 type transport system permease protein
MLTPIWAITRKELKLWFQRPGQWIILFVAPFLFVAIMGQVFGGGSMPTVSVYLVIEDEGRAAKRAVDLLEDVKNLNLDIVESRVEADRRVGQGQRMVAIIIPTGFGEALKTAEGAKVELIVDPAREQSAGLVVGQVNAALAPLLIDAEVARGVGTAFASARNDFGLDLEDAGINSEDAQKFLTAALQGVVASQVQDAFDDPLVRVELRPAATGGAIVRAPTILEWLVPGYTLFFAFFLVGMLAQVLLDERVTGTFRRLLSTPTSRAAILLGKIAPYFVITLLQIVGVIALCSLVFDISLGSDLGAFLLVAAATSATVVGLGIMIAALVRSTGQAGSVPNLIATAMAVVSGAFFPSIRVPVLEYATPHHWAIRGFQDVMTRNLGIAGVADEVAVLLGMAVLFFVIGVWRFRFE